MQIPSNVLAFLILLWYSRRVSLNSKIFIANEVEKYVFHCNRFKYIRFRRDSTSILLSAFPLRKDLILGNSYSVCATVCVAYLSERCPTLAKTDWIEKLRFIAAVAVTKTGKFSLFSFNRCQLHSQIFSGFQISVMHINCFDIIFCIQIAIVRSTLLRNFICSGKNICWKELNKLVEAAKCHLFVLHSCSESRVWIEN